MKCDAFEDGFRSRATKASFGANPVGGELQEDELAGSSADLETLESLISLAEEIEQILVPVEPALSFRQWLRDRLSAVVRQRLAWRLVQPSKSHRWAFILGATAGSLVPLLGVVVAYLLRSRLMEKEHAASH